MRSNDIVMKDNNILQSIFGSFDKYAIRLQDAFHVHLLEKHDNDTGLDHLIIEGDEEENIRSCSSAIHYLVSQIEAGNDTNDQMIEYVISSIECGKYEELSEMTDDLICVTTKGKPIKPKTVGQKRYIQAILRNTVVFGVGPAGTGKTYLAVAMAVKALRNHEVNRIILTRPAVEAGERLGFLPGDLQSKIDPYLRPLYDALYDMLGFETTAKYIEKMTIEIAPLAYMRGRTLDDSFIILDEAQNTTPEQMKMFLTRLGNGSKAVITGDITQRDLPQGTKSGLLEATKVLKDIDDISIHLLSDRDVVRHRLVQKIILAYDSYEKKQTVKAQRTHSNKSIFTIKKGLRP